ncbi:LamG domain-containing protein [Asticcacaulis sp. BYS171W]|uniref:LamG domain-containing protein n=1 Tax=Asticcacaulis aquaticus TaxID=2984212 RepID=A0ABT5HWR2_9CAUL|nr:LamG-like jellyroll fold domain-containing protein [Asticcacaulis aquaticus]MDC7684526.1 LamG domain-containing protein [Asticcacaulis aquaticus]
MKPYACLIAALLASPAVAGDGLLFSLSGDKGLVAEQAAGQAEPLFSVGAQTIPNGARGPGLGLNDTLTLVWPAANNIYAQRGTLSFFFRPREPLGEAPFPVFRVGAADGTSWDMAWLRIDWNGHGFDAFVTDTNLSRSRVSFKMDRIPAKEEWVHVAFAWDETTGVKLWINGKPAAQKDGAALYDSGLYAFGPFQRIVAPYQVHSMYNFRRSGDIDEIRIYDRRLDDAGVAALAANGTPAVPVLPDNRTAWLKRYGWETTAPAYLSDPVTRIRKVEFIDTRDLKAKMFKGADGIRETTWPGVYNRSRLEGRHDYFELPDWNVYSEGGKAYDLTLPDEPWNRIELTGAAYGSLNLDGKLLFKRTKGVERTSTVVADHTGGKLRFENTAQETPIQEIAAYNVSKGEVPAGYATLSYTVDTSADAGLYPALDEVRGFIGGRFVPEERAVAVVLPKGAPRKAVKPGAKGAPVVHLLIPGDFRDTRPGEGPTRFSYGWENMDAGLDGIALDLPAMKVEPTHNGLLPLNIRVRDPNWPERDLIDINVAVKPNEARTLWLDTRDRILPPTASFIITIAAAGGGFDAQALNGAQVRLVFKPASEAKAEHVADRMEQARDNFAFFVEEQPNIRAYPLWTRFERDITDVLRVDPGNALARAYWVEKNPEQPYAPVVLPPRDPDVPVWAARQIEDLKLYKRFVDWWIDERQVDNGEFGGGLSDDTDLVNAWVPLALMGVDPQRYITSQRKVLNATYANSMWSGGLSRIATDELHSYEEGINTVAQSMQMDWGNPTAIERGMAVAREFPRLFEVNPAGHRHEVSAYFSGTKIYREGTLGWQRQFGLLITHPGLLLVDYNGNPTTKALLLEVADGWLAHGKQDAKGNWSFPSDIEWATDKGAGNGVQSAISLFWAAYIWTGDAKYLRPIEGDIQRGNLSNLSQINADVMARAPGGTALAQKIVAGEVGGKGGAIDRNLGGIGDTEFAAFVRWQQTGDKSLISDLYGREIEANIQRMPILTEGHLWSDRVSVANELLQRTRLGGVGHRRNVYYPGNLVRWAFTGGKAEDVALLVRNGAPKAFRVIGYNLLKTGEVTGVLTADQMASGTWRVTGGIDADGDDLPDAVTFDQTVEMERGSPLPLLFPSRRTMVYQFTLVTPGEDPSNRPDIGLSKDDLTLNGRKLTVRVHSLGAKPTPAGTVIVETTPGKVLARAAFTTLAAPLDLLPKTKDVALTLPQGAKAVRVRLELDGTPKEISTGNNVVEWKP